MRSSTSLKSSHLYLKVVNKNNKKKKTKKATFFLKSVGGKILALFCWKTKK
jgi:hypothetical protein